MGYMRARRIATTATLTLLALPPFASAGHVETVRVDFAKPVERSSMVGFVHGMDMRNPPDELVEPLQPKLWRGKLRDVPFQRVQEVGGRYTYVLSDRWGYPGEGVSPPYEDFGRWERFVRQVARASDRHGEPVWDVWNEPDVPYFWSGTPEQLYETYRIAENVLREELGPDVVVGGPSTSGFRRTWLTGLLDWCLSRGCEVNALSWHEFPGGPIPALRDRLDEARETMVDARRYRALDIEEVHVNEAVSARDQYRPGELLGYMHYLEAGGADAAARACWSALDGQSNCYNDSLAGLVVPGSFEPRSVWWATKAYADGVGTRRLTRSSDDYVVGMGSARSDQPDSAQLLIAHLERRPLSRAANRAGVNVKVTLRSLRKLRWLGRRERLRVEIERFPDSGEAPLVTPRRRRAARVRIVKGEATLTLHDVRLHEAYRLRLTR